MTVAARVVVVQSLAGPSVAERLCSAGIRALCPMYSREVRHARRTEVRLYPLFSNYMFAWIEDEELRRVLRVRGTVDVLRKAGDVRALAVVSDEIISALSERDKIQPFEDGEDITVRHGRWEGLRGLYSRHENERVILLFQMLGRQVEMPFHHSEIGKTLHP